MEESKEVVENVVRVVEIKSKEESSDSPEVVVRLTPTGKVSHAKTRVYTQRYRKEWEHMTDFKDWLTSVPYQATRAFCKYCQKNLHAHRLSLLKHMCTLKHQRAAVQYNKRQDIFDNQQDQETSNDIKYIVEKLDADDDDEDYYDDNEDVDDVDDVDDTSYDDTSFAQEEVEEINIEGEEQVHEQVVEESESVIESPVFKKIRLQKEQSQDTLAQAMSHVNSDYLMENNEPIQLEMVVESDHDNDDDDDSKSYQFVKYGNSSNLSDQTDVQTEILNKNNKHNSDEIIQKNFNSSNESIKTLPTLESKNVTQASDNSKKVYFFSTGGKTYSLVKSKLPQLVMNQLNDKNFTVVAKLAKNDLKNIKNTSTELTTTTATSNVTTTSTASTSQEFTNKTHSILNTSSMMTKSVLLKKPIVSTHVLETSKGIPVCGLQVSLYKLQDGRWTFMHESVTTANGNCNDFSSCSKNSLTTGRYKLHYDVEKYYNMRKVATIYPFIEIVFDIKDPSASYHIPLLVSPFSYSTYKDSHR